MLNCCAGSDQHNKSCIFKIYVAFFVCVRKCAKFSPSQGLFTRYFSILQTLTYIYLRLPYTTADKINEFVLGRFMLVLGVVLSVSKWFSVLGD